jgi:hypothetical protein
LSSPLHSREHISFTCSRPHWTRKGVQMWHNACNWLLRACPLQNFQISNGDKAGRSACLFHTIHTCTSKGDVRYLCTTTGTSCVTVHCARSAMLLMRWMPRPLDEPTGFSILVINNIHEQHRVKVAMAGGESRASTWQAFSVYSMISLIIQYFAPGQSGQETSHYKGTYHNSGD